MNQLLTPKQVARAIGVSESSLKRWCDRGLLQTERTAGGHRRLPLSGVLGFLRQTGQPIKNPEILGLPVTSGKGDRTLEKGRSLFYEALIQGQELEARHILLNLYLSNISIASIVDEIIAPTFTKIGDNWDCGDIEIYQERLSCQICMKLLYELGAAIPKADISAPTALGATPAGDQLTLAVNSVELVLRDTGWRATNLGSNLPFSSLLKALERNKPRVFWLSISYIEKHDQLLEELFTFKDMASTQNTQLILGGRAITAEIRSKINNAWYPDSMTELQNVVSTIYKSNTKLDID
jgi:excisionase family DNA binding protein